MAMRIGNKILYLFAYRISHKRALYIIAFVLLMFLLLLLFSFALLLLVFSLISTLDAQSNRLHIGRSSKSFQLSMHNKRTVCNLIAIAIL